MLKVKRILRLWLPLAVVITALTGLVYVTVQQILRQGANDPQVQIAEDAARALGQGASIEDELPTELVDLGQSLAPFLIIFDEKGNPLKSSGVLHGLVPVVPAGIFDYVRQNGDDRVTWQPEAGVRIAAVVVGFTGNQTGFVLVGRSLREVEARADQMLTLAAWAWLTTIIASLVMVILGEWLLND